MTDLLDRLSTALADRYVVVQEIGSGGMAIVYLADDLRHDRQVGLKVLRPEIASALGTERFLREIKIAAKLNHPHIMPLHDSGEADGFLYYVMPYVEGESLRDRLNRETQLPLQDALQIAADVADALSYAHSQGVVHRDIKPENILFAAGHAIVADFGIARAVTEAGGENLTATGLAVGTPAYMSPEQASGVETVDARADIYALGCVLYETLAGETPFTGPTAQAILARKSVEAVPPLSSFRETVPPHVEHAIQQALARASADRQPTARAFAEALTSSAPDKTTTAHNSIAVLPFANMSADPQNQYFSDGMTEEVINAVSQIPDLRVTARTSAFAFKGKESDVREIGQKLNVGTLLEGSVRRAGNRVRVTAQLIDVSGGYHLWSERFDREFEDVFAIQDEIAQAIAERLSTQLAPAPVDSTPAARPNVEAYDTYLRGRYHHNAFTPDGTEKAIACYDVAIEQDPDFAPGHAALAEAYTLQAIGFSLKPSRETMPKAREAADQALQINPNLADAHLARGLVAMYYQWDYPAAKRGIESAIALNPNFAGAHFWHEFYWTYVEHRFEEALAATRRAMKLDPLAPSTKCRVGQVYLIFGHLDEAEERCREMIAVDPGHPMGHMVLADALLRRGMLDEAVAAAENAARLGGPAVAPVSILAMCNAKAGHTAKAREFLNGLTDRSQQGFVSGFWLAMVHAALGDTDRAFEWLGRAHQDRDCNLLYLTAIPRVTGLHEDPRFDALLHDIGLGHLAGVEHS